MTKTNLILILIIIILSVILFRSNDSKKIIELENQKEINLNRLDSLNLVYDSLIISIQDNITDLKKQSVISEYWYSKYHRSNKKLKSKVKKYEEFIVPDYNDKQYDSIITKYRLDKERASRINNIKSN